MEINKDHLKMISIAGLAGIIIGGVIFTFLHLRPYPPNITIEFITVAQLDMTELNHVRAAFQLTFSFANPGRGCMTFDHIHLVANYNGFPVTTPIVIPPFDEKPYKRDIYYAWVVGGSIPLELELVRLLSHELRREALSLGVVVDGDLCWKLGGWPTKAFKLYAASRLLVGNGTSTKTAGGARTIDTSAACRVYLIS